MMKTMLYNFYFDESFHSRTITAGTFKDNDYFNSYISTGVGFKTFRINSVFNKYMNFEEKARDIYGIDSNKELKSDIISKKHYKYGIATFNNNEIKLYKEFFEFLINEDIIYYISICDKLEYLLLQCKYSAPSFLNVRACIYSIVKLINVYRPRKVVLDILTKNNNLLNDLRKFCKQQLKVNGTLKLKELENTAIKNIILFLNYIDASNINFEFDYNFTYLGLTLLMQEMSINNVNVIIDKEGSNRIYSCACSYNFNKVEQVDSKSCEGVRISDMFCGFISKMMRALFDDTKNDPNTPYTKQHLISVQWFDISKEQFELYKSIIKYIKKYNDVYYGSYVSIYFDLFSLLMGLLYYFDGFETYESYSKIKNQEHYKNANQIIKCRVMGDIDRIK